MPTGAGTPSYEVDAWSVLPKIPAVLMLTGEYLDITGGPDLNNTDMTLFFVFEATDITGNLAIIGSASSSSFPRRVTLQIFADGSILFNFSGALPGNCRSAAGVIVGGQRYYVTLRFSGTTGMIIRVQGVQVAATPSQTTSQIDVGLFVLGRSKDDGLGIGDTTGVSKLYTWAAAFHAAASDQEILDYEAFLVQEFFPRILTAWDSCGPSPGTNWADC